MRLPIMTFRHAQKCHGPVPSRNLPLTTRNACRPLSGTFRGAASDGVKEEARRLLRFSRGAPNTADAPWLPIATSERRGG
jgi:hypothetical protein